MTRRKGRPSPPPSSLSKIPGSFEIPASLHQFSTISRSLAATMATGAGSYNNRPLSKTTSIPQVSPKFTPANALSQPAPNSQSSSHAPSSFSTTPRAGQYATNKANPLKRSLSEAQHDSRSVQQPPFSKPVSRDGEQSNTHSQARPKATTAVSVYNSHSPQTLHATVSTFTPAEEPPLRPGEAPVLATHPNLIAQLIARKRAENEKLGNRERWARRQREHRLSQSPATQSANEPKPQHGRNEMPKAPPQSSSNPPLARSVSTTPTVKPVTSIVFNAQTPVAESPSTPATEDSIKPTENTSERRQSNDNDSLFESPFSSPIVEFLEKATDNAGLKDPLQNHGAMSTKPVGTVAAAPIPHPESAAKAESSRSTTNKFKETSAIPPLFSDKPLTNQSQSQPFRTNSMQSPSVNVHQQAQTDSLTPAQGQMPQHQQRGGPPQLAPRQLPAPRPIPYYPQNVGMPGFYRVEMSPSWSAGSSNFVATPVSSMPSTHAYDQQILPASMAYSPYGVGSMGAYVVGPDLPPAPGPLRTYGNTVATTAAGQTKEQLIMTGHITAADMVAGINTRFKIATKDDFTVPKR
ncbi:uncharacterized protein Z520_05822 [Fonsecaea multimorphosa CBS 102226]|uniref:Uncharacterized protein n=1 Tax=Fonsecaea multimorphosa CBS 102226 TaxID=1442371 RepID=A0A0D2INC1_9EURO|nr:uncharacterized protein Z520_05822 [Fonsecaea multimorphosa CBS 102226]KIX98521.1 hypothetical protein Z520_05822 [Fonsecaea multimorphosa CBS 102226]OAL24715.1 hypothetical protein AYO22_05504 [Fonsecaea multimorphosa]